jgi:hypothetical protein
MPDSLTPLEDSLRARLSSDRRIVLPIHAREPAEVMGATWIFVSHCAFQGYEVIVAWSGQDSYSIDFREFGLAKKIIIIDLHDF